MQNDPNLPIKRAYDILFDRMVGRNNPIVDNPVKGVHYVKYSYLCDTLVEFEVLLRKQIAQEIIKLGTKHGL